MNGVKRMIPLMVLGVVFLGVIPAQAGTTGPSEEDGLVSVTFERNEDKVLRADAFLRAPSDTVWSLIRDLGHYPSLVSWVEESRAATGSRDPDHEVYMALRLPWPVGRVWNVMQVEDVGHHAVRWNMINGTIKENSGYVRVEVLGNFTRVTYESRVDVGFPTWLTDPIERAMIRQFLTRLQMQACPILVQGGTGANGNRAC